VDELIEIYREHQAMGSHHMMEDPGEPEAIRIDDPGFQRFMDAQLTWDRAMAEALAGFGDRALVIGVVGSGHLEGGHGVPHQLAALGVPNSAVLLPWDQGRDCSQLLVPGLADAVFGVAASPMAVSRDKPRLGVMIQGNAGALTVLGVSPDSIAQVTGIMAGDIIVEAAGLAMAEPADLVAVIQRQAPGTWLPLSIERGGQHVELVARFPPEPEAAP
jgi:membrane-associated protease RseP (regulator of RpoE activity)